MCLPSGSSISETFRNHLWSYSLVALNLLLFFLFLVFSPRWMLQLVCRNGNINSTTLLTRYTRVDIIVLSYHLVNDGNRICCTTQESVYIHHGHTLMIIAVCKSVFHTASKQIFEPGKAWARGYIRYSPTSSFLYLSSAYFFYYLLILSLNLLIRVITSDCYVRDLC